MDRTAPEQTPDSTEHSKASDRGRLVTVLACAACTLVFIGLLQERDPDSWDTLSRYGYLSPTAIWNGKYWALLSSVFVHREVLHFVFNIYWLWVLGGVLERTIGSLLMLVFFVAAAIVSSGVEFAISGYTGIGASGVGYAIFGFMWTARERIEPFKKTVTKRIIVLFLGWAVICILGTLLKRMYVANAAHIGGLLFGAGVALVFVVRKHGALMVAGLSCLILIAVVPLFWCPWSVGWVSKQGYDAHVRHDYPKSLTWYQRTIDLGGDSVWALENMALAYRSMGDQTKYEDTLERLRLLNPEAAQEVEQGLAGAPQKK